MATRRVKAEESDAPRARPATTPEGREAQLAALAYDLAEKQLRDGTASSQVQTHFLKAMSSREALEKRRLEGEIEINRIKQEVLASEKRTEALYSKALNAMRRYSGAAPIDEEPDAY